MGKQVVPFALNANYIKQGILLVGLVHSFAGMVQNEDTTSNIVRIPSSLDVMSIFLNYIIR